MLQKNFEKLKEDEQTQITKENLFSDRKEDGKVPAGYMEGGTKIVQQNNKLLEAKRTAFEIEDTSITIQKELNRNTDTLRHALNRTKEADLELGTSNYLVNAIQRRLFMNKITLYIVLASLVTAFLFIIVMRFIY